MELGSEFNLRFYEQPAYDNFTEYIKEFNSLYTDGGRSALRILIYIYNFNLTLYVNPLSTVLQTSRRAFTK